MSNVLGAEFVRRLTQPQVEFLLEALERNMAGHLPTPTPGSLEAYSPHYVRSCVAGFMKYDIRFPPSKHTTPLTKAVGEEVLALLRSDPCNLQEVKAPENPDLGASEKAREVAIDILKEQTHLPQTDAEQAVTLAENGWSFHLLRTTLGGLKPGNDVRRKYRVTIEQVPLD